MNQTTATPAILPQTSRSSDALQRLIAEALDNQLLHYAESGEAFTISQVRDQLLMQPELEDLDPVFLRCRVRDRLTTLERHNLVVRVGVKGKNRPLFRMNLQEPREGSVDDDDGTETVDSAPTPPELTHFLEKERHQLRAAMQAALSEAEYYRQILRRFPQTQARVSPLLDAALEHGGDLKGQLDANIKLRNVLDGKEVEE